MKYIITNFVYGTGPYLRTTELAIAINKELEKENKEQMGIIVPWVYGEKQKRIMLEEFAEYDKAFPGRIVLDPVLGGILKKVFYGSASYEEALRTFVLHHETLNKEAHEHLSRDFAAEDFSGKRRMIQASDIAMEINRSPRIVFDVAPAYSVTFGYMSEILRAVLEEPQEKIALDRELVKKAIPLAERIEEDCIFHALAHPGTFSYLEQRKHRFLDELSIPPTITPPLQSTEQIEEGIYVTITGIPGLERLYEEARTLGLKLYSNDTNAVLGSEYLSPHHISNPNIKLQFARSGWGSVWLSQLSGTPFVAPDFDPKDDPEIYFNNTCIETLKLGIIYRGQTLSDIIRETEDIKVSIQTHNKALLSQFGTLNGNEHAAKCIVVAMEK